MADLARIKRNVAKMASMNAPETDIDNYIASEGVTIDDVRNFKPLALSDVQKQQITANNTAYEQRQEENRPFWDKNPIGRLAVAGLQGIANAGLNPAGYVARAAGIDTKPFTPENAAERGVELGGQYGFDAAALGGIGNIAKGAGYLGKGEKIGSKIAQSVLAPESIATMAVAPAVGGGIAEGITNPTNEFERTAANIAGAMTPAAIQGMLSTTKQTLATGLKNILNNNKANAAVSKGIRASENVAQQVADDAPAAYNELNSEMAKALDDAVGRKLNIANANTNQQQRYNDFIRDNADMELVNFAPTRDELRFYAAESKFNTPRGKPLPKEAEELLKDRASKAGLDIDGTIEHYTNNGSRGKYVRTLANTVENPDIVFSSGNKGYIIKKYDENGKPFFDFITKKDGKLYNKFDTNAQYVDNQIQKTAENVSLSSRVQQPTDAGYIRPAAKHNNNITHQTVVVNKKLPSLKQFTQGLDDFQKDALNQALSKGASMSTNAKGTLGATHRAQEVLNDMIDASYDTSIIGQRKPTTETRQLMTVKERLNQILEPSGVKPYDVGISKAKALQANFEKGYNFKPSEIKLENMGLNMLRDRKAFLQGRIQKILDNTLSDGGTNLAIAIKKDENTLRKLLPASKFNNLMSKANQIETNFKRLKSLEGQANNRLVRDSQQGSSPWRENIESRGSIIGRSLDVLSGLLNRRGNTNLANQYLGNSNQVVTRGGLKGAFANAAQTGLRQALIEAMDNN